MKGLNKPIGILCVIILSLCIILLIKNSQSQTATLRVDKLESVVGDLIAKKEENEFLIEKVKNSLFESLRISELIFPGAMTLVKTNGQKTFLSETQNSSVVFFYKESNCQLCVDQEILLLNRFIEDNPILSVTILAALNAPLDIRFLRNSVNNKIDIYGVDPKELDFLPDGVINIPFYFFLDKDGKSSYRYIPSLDLEHLSFEYLEFIMSL